MLTSKEKLYLTQILKEEKKIILEDQEAGCNVSDELEVMNGTLNKLKG